MLELSLQGRTALVCGSTQGIGKATALAMAQCGANIVLMARNDDALKAVCNEIAATGSECSYIVADFSDSRQVGTAIMSHVATGSNIDILVNNTGGPPAGPIVDATPDDFLAAFHSHPHLQSPTRHRCYPRDEIAEARTNH